MGLEERNHEALLYYCEKRVRDLSGRRHQLDKNFVPLALFLGRGQESPEGLEDRTFYDLSLLLQETTDYPVLVVIGVPGAGKTTLLEHLELQVATAFVNGSSTVVPFFVSLNGYDPEHDGEPILSLR